MPEPSAPFVYWAYTTAFDREVSGRDLLMAVGEDRVSEEHAFPAPVHCDDVDPPRPLALARHLGARPFITLLVDHSGSLRGAPAEWVIAAVRHAGDVLEASHVAFDLLGFTTTTWRGGQSRAKWIDDGRPACPGRLCDLLHIVHRDGRAPTDDWRESLNLLRSFDTLKENVDGEALRWAYARASATNPSYWLCVVITDGAPRDDSTSAANQTSPTTVDNSFLCRHLQEVIRDLDRIPNVQIAGFGVSYDVRRFYADHAYALPGFSDPRELTDFLRGLIEEGSVRP